MSSSSARRARRADRKKLELDMPLHVRRAVERLALRYAMTPLAVLAGASAILSRTLPGNRCVGCGETIVGAPAGIYAIDAPRAAVGSVCTACAERYQKDRKFAAKIDREGFRAAHHAGPDDVAGHG